MTGDGFEHGWGIVWVLVFAGVVSVVEHGFWTWRKTWRRPPARFRRARGPDMAKFAAWAVVVVYFVHTALVAHMRSVATWPGM